MQPETLTPPRFMEWKELTLLIGSIRTRSLVARPTTIEQCREALAYCRQHGMTILRTPRFEQAAVGVKTAGRYSWGRAEHLKLHTLFT